MSTKEEESHERLFNRQAEEIQKLRGHLNVVRDILSGPLNVVVRKWKDPMSEEIGFYSRTRW